MRIRHPSSRLGRLAAPFLVLALSAVPALAQKREIVERYPDGEIQIRYTVDAEGRKDGTYERLRRDGSVMERKQFRAGRLNGRYEELDRAGEPLLVMEFKNDERHGKLVEFGDGGRPLLIERYRDGELHGRRETFGDDGSSLGFVTYAGGVLDGKFEEQRHDGVVRDGEYANGQLTGAVKVSSGRRVLSKQIWSAGELVRLDGIEAFPISSSDLRRELTDILMPEQGDDTPPTGVDDPLWPRRMTCLRILQAYRALCSLPWQEMELNPEWNSLCDDGAELCRVIGRLDHTPPKPDGMDPDAYRRGYEATSHSNLHQGGSMETSVDGYMDDSDARNIARVGHRRWCLNPAMGKTGFGEAPGFSAMWSMDGSGGTARGMSEICYPPRGWTPSDFFSSHHAWSIQLLRGSAPDPAELDIDIRPLDDFCLAEDREFELDYKDVAPASFGTGPCLIFRPVGLSTAPGSKYLVTITEQGDAQPRWRYVVGFCDPVRDGRVR